MVAALEGDTIAGYCWLEMEFADLEFFDIRCPLRADEAYLSKVLVHPETRGSGLGRQLIAAAVKVAARDGMRRAVSVHVPENHPMRAVYTKGGWVYFQEMGYWRFGPVRRYAIVGAGGVRRAAYHSAAGAAQAVLSAFSGI
jgi:GNAT superfamily N-acetyltransferase